MSTPKVYGYCCYHSHFSVEAQKNKIKEYAKEGLDDIVIETDIHEKYHSKNGDLVVLIDKLSSGDIILFHTRFIFVEDPKKDLSPLTWIEANANMKGIILVSISDSIDTSTYKGRYEFGSYDNYFFLNKEFNEALNIN
jgi:DNA invertase Pin-like site-specific DNA recombinase